MNAPILLRALLLFLIATAASPGANWPQWRGPAGDGITPETDLPLTWSSTENVKWKTALPEPGNSTPIVWEDRIFITQPAGKRRTVTCFARKDGRQLWQEGPVQNTREPTHKTNPYASASPVTDGERVIAWFGSAGLWCWDLEGKEQWHVDLGKHEHEWGYAGSPVILGDLCFLNFGPGERTFLIAVDKRTGAKVWQADPPPLGKGARTDGFAGQEEGVVGSWSTPIVVNAEGRDELVMSWPGKLAAYEPATGRELWTCRGLNPLIYTSPVFGEGVIVASGGYGGSTIAVRPGGSGDVTDTHRLWHKERDKQRIGTGIITGGHFYVLNTPGTAQCIELATGREVWEERLKGSGGSAQSWASMVLSGDRIYVTNQAGDTSVIEAAPKFEPLALNVLGDGLTNASIVASEGGIFIRTHKHLWCIGGAAE